jgi:predicted nuclease with TOPRIM domain
MKRGKRNTSRTSRRTVREKTVKGPPFGLDTLRDERTSLMQQLDRLSEALKVAEKELARISAENARLVAENSLLRARVASRAGSIPRAGG